MRNLSLVTAVAGVGPQELADIKAKQQTAGQAAKQNANDAVDEALQGNFQAAVENAAAFSTNFLNALFIMPGLGGGRTYSGQKVGMGKAALQLAKACTGPLKGHVVLEVISPGFLSLGGRLLDAAEYMLTSIESTRARVVQATDPLYTQTGAMINDAYDLMDPGLRLDPLMATTMQEVTKFVEDRLDRAAKSRKENEAITQRAQQAAESAISAKAREEGRQEAKKAIADQLSVTVK